MVRYQRTLRLILQSTAGVQLPSSPLPTSTLFALHTPTLPFLQSTATTATPVWQCSVTVAQPVNEFMSCCSSELSQFTTLSSPHKTTSSCSQSLKTLHWPDWEILTNLLGCYAPRRLCWTSELSTHHATEVKVSRTEQESCTTSQPQQQGEAFISSTGHPLHLLPGAFPSKETVNRIFHSGARSPVQGGQLPLSTLYCWMSAPRYHSTAIGRAILSSATATSGLHSQGKSIGHSVRALFSKATALSEQLVTWRVASELQTKIKLTCSSLAPVHRPELH